MVRIPLVVALLLAGCSDTIGSPRPWDVSEVPPEDTPAVDDEHEAIDEPETVDEPDPKLEAESEKPPAEVVEPEKPGELPNAAPDAWSGRWLVHQPYHARYEASVYEFRPDGVLLHVESSGVGLGEEPTEVGVVGKCAESLTETWEECTSNGTECETRESTRCVEWSPVCTFGDRWGSIDEQTLLVQGDCDDGVSRVIHFTFPAPPPEDPYDLGVAPESIVVDGEEWEHNWWRWAWVRCEGEDDPACEPFL